MLAGEGSWRMVPCFALEATLAHTHAAELCVSNQDQDQGVFPTVWGLY